MQIFPLLLSALGGAFMVYAAYDDATGGLLLDLLMIVLSGIMVLRKSLDSK